MSTHIIDVKFALNLALAYAGAPLPREDRFETDHRGLGTLVFQRNGDGEPLGYRVHTERVRDVWFERLMLGDDI